MLVQEGFWVDNVIIANHLTVLHHISLHLRTKVNQLWHFWLWLFSKIRLGLLSIKTLTQFWGLETLLGTFFLGLVQFVHNRKTKATLIDCEKAWFRYGSLAIPYRDSVLWLFWVIFSVCLSFFPQVNASLIVCFIIIFVFWTSSSLLAGTLRLMLNLRFTVLPSSLTFAFLTTCFKKSIFPRHFLKFPGSIIIPNFRIIDSSLAWPVTRFASPFYPLLESATFTSLGFALLTSLSVVSLGEVELIWIELTRGYEVIAIGSLLSFLSLKLTVVLKCY